MLHHQGAMAVRAILNLWLAGTVVPQVFQVGSAILFHLTGLLAVVEAVAAAKPVQAQRRVAVLLELKVLAVAAVVPAQMQQPIAALVALVALVL
jgi:hypothetical protein